jgi:hypothetical protein
MDQELVSYITQAQKHGLTDYEIKQNLLNAGWEASAVEENFVFAKAAENKTPSTKDSFVQPAANFPPTGSHTQNRLAPNSAITITDQTFSHASGNKPFYKKPLFYLLIFMLLALAGGAYGYYNYVYLTPVRIWNNFLSQKALTTTQSQYSLSYDSGPSASSTQQVVVTVSGSGAMDMTDPKSAKLNGNLGLSLNAGILNFNVNSDYVLLGQVLYLNLGSITALKSFTGNQNLKWVKFDEAELKNYASSHSQSFTSSTSTLDTAALAQKLTAIWVKSPVISPTDFLARENLNGIAVYHLKMQLNTPAIKQNILDSMDVINSLENSSQKMDATQQAELDALLTKFQTKQFEVWVGRSDYHLYKLVFTINAPSADDFSNSQISLLSVQEQSREAKRLSDIRQLQSALVLYNYDFGGYPAGTNGIPENLNPKYITQISTAPEPADGPCSEYFNSYWYQASGKPKSVNGQQVYPTYTLTYCLGQDTGGHKAGIGMATALGIQDNINCPSTPENCAGAPADTQSQAFVTALNKMTFGGQITINTSYSNWGKSQNIVAPDGAVDFLDLVKGLGLQSSSTTQSTASQTQ